MRVEEERSGSNVYETGGGGKWRQCVCDWRRREVEAVCMRVEEEGSGGCVYASGGGEKWRQCL
jgi:hypothetical protein